MKRSRLPFVLGLMSLTAGLANADTPATPKEPGVTKITGPYTHANLSLFLLHGPDAVPGRKFLTLQEALEKKQAIVRETGQVNQLSVENLAPDVELFIMTGDIVKGGRQDRILAIDLIVPPKSGAVPILSFCIESGRWTNRGSEDAGQFTSSPSQAVGNDLKRGFNRARSQQEVWDKVGTNLSGLNRNVGKVVQNAVSPTSLQLALEDKDLQERVQLYEKDLVGLLARQSDAIGFAVVVNGKISSAEVFGSAELLRRLWPKLLRSAATEALAEFQKDKKFESIAVKTVETFLAAALAAEKKEENLLTAQAQPQRGNRANATQSQTPQPPNDAATQQPAQAGAPGKPAAPPRVRIYRYDSDKAFVVECQDRQQPGVVLHRSFLAK